MEISAEESKVMVTSQRQDGSNNNQIEIKGDGEKLEELASFQYLGSVLNYDITSDNEIKKRLAIATGQLAELNNVWNTRGIRTSTQVQLLRSLIIPIALYGCESWTYNKNLEKRIKCIRIMLLQENSGHHSETE